VRKKSGNEKTHVKKKGEGQKIPQFSPTVIYHKEQFEKLGISREGLKSSPKDHRMVKGYRRYQPIVEITKICHNQGAGRKMVFLVRKLKPEGEKS